MSMHIAWERRGDGFPLVLVHGLGYARWGWEPVVDLLGERYETILFDNRGIGESDAPPGPYSAAALGEDTLRVLEEAGVERAHLLGTSLGGMVAQELALAAPERVEKLVLVCTTPGGTNAAPMPEQTVRLMAQASTLEPEVALRRFVENALAPDPPESIVERILAHRIQTGQPTEAWLAQAAAGASFDAWDRLPELRTATLVLHGTADNVVNVRNAELLAERIPDARAELFPGCGHLLFWEQPEKFVEVVGEFLA
ncbi:MAG: alpha/beta fold hydrolase [Actinobacteria bacterium]|nr:alpha/beta fold hydrolase [Actinomycetota bacterium]